MSKTARDFLDEKSKDPKYQALKQKKEKELEEFANVLADDEKELVDEINAIGYDIKSVWDFVNNNNKHEFLRSGAPSDYSSAYPILVKHLKINHHERIREGIIRSLTEKTSYEIAGQALIEEFYKESYENLKWVLSFACVTVIPEQERAEHPEIEEFYNSQN